MVEQERSEGLNPTGTSLCPGAFTSLEALAPSQYE